MADTRWKDLLRTAELPAADDYFLVDGETEGIWKMLAGTFRDARNLRYNLGVAASQERAVATKVGEGTLLSVKDFGAKGDFTTDDSDAILAVVRKRDKLAEDLAGLDRERAELQEELMQEIGKAGLRSRPTAPEPPSLSAGFGLPPGTELPTHRWNRID